MTDTTASAAPPVTSGGMDRMSAGLWLAVLAAVLQLSAVGSDFYQVGDTVRDAWFGVPHTADLILISGLVTLVLVALTAANRSPVGGRAVGLIVGVTALVATIQLGYRMAVPPFGGCLTYTCGATPKNTEITLLIGIFIGLVGCIAALVGGFVHAFSSRASATRPNFWVADEQTGSTPWLGLAALSSVGMFVVGYTVLDFYSVPQRDSVSDWSAWLSIPHTSTIILLLAVGVALLVRAASRSRSPMGPQALGATIAVAGFVMTARTLYRVIVSPFFSGPAEGVFDEGVVINAPAYAALALGVITIVAGLVHANSAREQSAAARTSGQPSPAT